MKRYSSFPFINVITNSKEGASTRATIIAPGWSIRLRYSGLTSEMDWYHSTNACG